MAAAGVAALGASHASAATDDKATPERPRDISKAFRYGLNTATIRGQNLPIDRQFEIAAKAGYDSVEPWIGDIAAYRSKGGSLADLKKKIADLGLTVDSAIGFAEWVVDDDARRKKGMETARRDMELVAAIGGTRVAAPPAGATDQANLDLRKAAERYRTLIELGATMNIVPQVEVWGFSKALQRLSECAYVAIESRHPKACVLPDVYHLYKGGSDHATIGLVASAMHCIHMNDYPATPPREKITDAERIYPGDGIAPTKQLLQALHAGGFRGVLSLELFNRAYWLQDAQSVAQTGLDKMKLLVRAALE
jgi:sugar phosphate isomerase/epimerase